MGDVTATQLRALRVIDKMENTYEGAHDLEGDLSAVSGNWPATHRGLVRRGLVKATHHPELTGYAEPWWSYRLTEAGRRQGF